MTGKQAPMSDDDFVKKATMTNKFEIEAGRLAGMKASDGKLKAFGQMMVTDHGAALKELEAAIQGTSATAPVLLETVHQTKLDALKSKSGGAFDAAYKADMRRDTTIHWRC